MRCVPVTEANGPLKVVGRETPRPGPGQIGVTVEACGLCHSDVFTTSAGFPGIEELGGARTRLPLPYSASTLPTPGPSRR